MPVTILDPKAALVVIDLQNGMTGLPAAHPIADVVAHASALAKAFRDNGRPVVFVNVDGGAAVRTEQPRRMTDFPAGWTDLIPALNANPRSI